MWQKIAAGSVFRDILFEADENFRPKGQSFSFGPSVALENVTVHGEDGKYVLNKPRGSKELQVTTPDGEKLLFRYGKSGWEWRKKFRGATGAEKTPKEGPSPEPPPAPGPVPVPVPNPPRVQHPLKDWLSVLTRHPYVSFFLLGCLVGVSGALLVPRLFEKKSAASRAERFIPETGDFSERLPPARAKASGAAPLRTVTGRKGPLFPNLPSP